MSIGFIFEINHFKQNRKHGINIKLFYCTETINKLIDIPRVHTRN